LAPITSHHAGLTIAWRLVWRGILNTEVVVATRARKFCPSPLLLPPFHTHFLRISRAQTAF
jgi:hypothetical protein